MEYDMKQFLYLALWFLGAKFFGRKPPLQTVLFVTDKCNLRCRHCCICTEKQPVTKSTTAIREELEYSYRLGSRFVDFEGGEPFLWNDGKNDINTLVRLAKEIGFFSCTITTNAQIPFTGSEADSMWVSLDGIGRYHDDIRGEGTFDTLCKNIAASGHKALSANMVINNRNYPCVGETIQFVKDNPALRSISLNFHTPFPGTESLVVDQATRERVVDEVIALKKQRYPIMNSLAGLELLKRNNFKTECWVTNFIMVDGTRHSECQGKAAGLCSQCGFGMAGEMHSIFSLRPSTILAGLKLRILG
jgi:MoaA/NifB/PqqE/SkfB family radical SAM enzyme